MAEFKKVMRQAKRMCEANGCTCNGCLLIDEKGECRHRDAIYKEAPEDWKLDKLAEIERIVMDWAEKHPEPRYPSWHEAWKQLFPDGQGSPCPAAYGMKYEPEWCGSGDCKRCKNRPIPADIAEKLGVKPIGGKTDENA